MRLYLALLTGLLFTLLVTISPSNASATPVKFDGEFVQGGMVVGHTEPGTEVALNKVPVRLSKDGVFVIAFGRDAPPIAKLRIKRPNGEAFTCILMVEQREYRVQRIDGLPENKVTPRGPEVLARIQKEAALIAGVRELDSPRQDFLTGFSWPVDGKITGVYGSQRVLNGKPRRPHNGVDVAADTGTPVTAAAKGVVALTHTGMFFGGKTVMIDHGHGLTSVYIHLDTVNVKQGQEVEAGAMIGTVGQTGRATGPHLHWGVTWFGQHLDPERLAGPLEKTTAASN